MCRNKVQSDGWQANSVGWVPRSDHNFLCDFLANALIWAWISVPPSAHWWWRLWISRGGWGLASTDEIFWHLVLEGSRGNQVVVSKGREHLGALHLLLRHAASQHGGSAAEVLCCLCGEVTQQSHLGRHGVTVWCQAVKPPSPSFHREEEMLGSWWQESLCWSWNYRNQWWKSDCADRRWKGTELVLSDLCLTRLEQQAPGISCPAWSSVACFMKWAVNGKPQ